MLFIHFCINLCLRLLGINKVIDDASKVMDLQPKLEKAKGEIKVKIFAKKLEMYLSIIDHLTIRMKNSLRK